jgi:hypothetical protein
MTVIYFYKYLALLQVVVLEKMWFDANLGDDQAYGQWNMYQVMTAKNQVVKELSDKKRYCLPARNIKC